MSQQYFIVLNILFITEMSVYGYNFYYVVEEELKIGETVGALKNDFLNRQKTNDDIIKNAASLRFFFSPSSKNHNSFFHLDNSSGTISNSRILDREVLCKPGGLIPSCRFAVDVQVTPKRYFAILKIVVEVRDVNDNPPKFLNSEHKIEISHRVKQGQSFQLPVAQDDDTEDYGVDKYFIREDSSDSDSIFLDTFKLISLKMSDGSFDVRLELRSKVHLNESKTIYGAIVVVDKGTPPKSDILLVVVTIIKTLETGPHFEATSYRFCVTENIESGAFVGHMKVNSTNSTSLKYLIYNQLGTLRKLPFSLSSRSGELYVNGSIDYEKEHNFRFSVIVISSVSSRSSFATVEVEVIDTNDNPPEIIINSFTPNNKAQLKENYPEGTFISHIRVFDKDKGLNARSNCYAQSSFFALQEISNSTDNQEYKLISTTKFDREEFTKHDVQLVCEELDIPKLSTRVLIEVDIIDENDNAPFFSQSSYIINLPENTAQDSIPLMKIQAIDFDEGQNAVLTYYLSSLDTNSPLLIIDELDGNIYSRYTFDYESDPHKFSFVVRAVDSGENKMTGSTTLILNILDANDNAPRFSQNVYEFHLLRSKFLEGITIGIINSFDDDKSLANNRLIYTIDGSTLGEFFSIDPFTGELSLIQIPPEESLYTFNVTASNTFSRDCLNSSVQVIIYLVGKTKISLVTPSEKNDIQMFTGRVRKGDQILQIQVKDFHLMQPRFQLTSGNDKDQFEMDPHSGVIIANKEIKEGLSLFNFTILIQDSSNNYDQQSFNLPIFVNNTSDQQNFLRIWTHNSTKFLCAMRFRKRAANDLDADHSASISTNFYEFDSKIHAPANFSRQKVKFSLVTLEDMNKDVGNVYVNDRNKVIPEVPYDPWLSCSRKACEEETSLTDSGKGTSDEGDVATFHARKIKECKLSQDIGTENFNQSIVNREKKTPIHQMRYDALSFKSDDFPPVIPLELTFIPTLRSHDRNCELCLMDQMRKNKADSVPPSVTTTV